MLNQLHKNALSAAMRGGTEGWGVHADSTKHIRYSIPVSSRRRCHCGCKRRATHLGCCNGLGMITGCELRIARWVKTK